MKQRLDIRDRFSRHCIERRFDQIGNREEGQVAIEERRDRDFVRCIEYARRGAARSKRSVCKIETAEGGAIGPQTDATAWPCM